MKHRETLGQLQLVFTPPELSDDLRAELAAHVSPGWAGLGECRSTGDDTWFPEDTDTTGKADALQRCDFCPVRRSCLAYALSAGEEYGVWGGTTEVQRHVLTWDLDSGQPVADVLDRATLLPEILWRAA